MLLLFWFVTFLVCLTVFVDGVADVFWERHCRIGSRGCEIRVI